MDTRIVERPAIRLVGHAARVPLIRQGVNPHIQQHVAALPTEEHLRLKALSDTEPAGLLAVCDDPWRLLPGPEIVAVLERADDFSTATCELWLPVERA